MEACEHYEELISAFIDGTLAEEERAALMEHMSGCAACQAYFDDLIAIHEVMDTGPMQAPENFVSTVMDRVRGTPQERPGRKVIPLRPWWRWAAAAACCAVVALGIWNFQNLTGTQPTDLPGLPAGTARSAGEAEDAFYESDGDKWAAITGAFSPQAKMEETFEEDAVPDTHADAAGGKETASAGGSAMSAQSSSEGGKVRNDSSDSDSLSASPTEDGPTPEPAEAPIPALSMDAEGVTKESSAESGIMPSPLSLENGEAMAGVPDPDGTGKTGWSSMVDYKTAVEQFGRELVPCTGDGFEGYSLHWVSAGGGQNAVYTAVDYCFSNGSVQVDQLDRSESLDRLLEDTKSVVYNGETFFVKDASIEGYTSVQYYPNGESGLGYSACFVSEMERSEVFELILSLVIP